MMQVEHIVASWLRTRHAMTKSVQGLAALRECQWTALQPVLARTPALAGFVGRRLDDFPITEIGALRSDYGAWNSLGLCDADLRALADAAESGEASGEISAGWSTGSSGANRGLFLASRAERADYIGQSLARLLPFRALLQTQRFALHLRASNALYSDAGRKRFRFAHFPLGAPLRETMEGLAHYQPTILVAPPSRLLEMAKSGINLPHLRFLFCGSEPMSAAERGLVEQHFGLVPRAIYQATEGFLGAECRDGKLHLNDHSLEIELQEVPGTDGYRPVITDLRRTSQPVVRLRGDDFLELDAGPCRCGYAGRVIRPIEGRVQDIWHFEDRCITPRQVVVAVEESLEAAWRWQAIACQEGITLRVAPDCPDETGRRASVVLEQCAGTRVMVRHDFAGWSGPKRRKVMWRDG